MGSAGTRVMSCWRSRRGQGLQAGLVSGPELPCAGTVDENNPQWEKQSLSSVLPSGAGGCTREHTCSPFCFPPRHGAGEGQVHGCRRQRWSHCRGRPEPTPPASLGTGVQGRQRREVWVESIKHQVRVQERVFEVPSSVRKEVSAEAPGPEMQTCTRSRRGRGPHCTAPETAMPQAWCGRQ